MITKKIAKAIGSIIDRALLTITNNLLDGIEEVYRWSAVLAGASSADREALADLSRVSEMYMVAETARAKATAMKAVSDAIKNETSVEEALGQAMEKAKANLTRIIENEVSVAKNLGALEGIVEKSPSDDPVMFWICQHDHKLCEECKELHLLPDGYTPRVWKVSEVEHGYHKKGDPSPKFGGLHPNERCAPASVLPGWGFDRGQLRWISDGHDEWATQRKLDKK